jgi:hypothetical protein
VTAGSDSWSLIGKLHMQNAKRIAVRNTRLVHSNVATVKSISINMCIFNFLKLKKRNRCHCKEGGGRYISRFTKERTTRVYWGGGGGGGPHGNLSIGGFILIGDKSGGI